MRPGLGEDGSGRVPGMVGTFGQGCMFAVLILAGFGAWAAIIWIARWINLRAWLESQGL